MTTRMVAERAGLRPGLVHYHFDSVTDLLIDSSLRAAQAEVARILPPVLTRADRDALAELIQAGASYGTGPGGPGQGAAVFVEMLLGFAGKAQWYRNITANPRVRVSTGFGRNMAALAQTMPPAESGATLRDFIEHHPAEWQKMRGIFEHVSGRPVDTMPMVRLRVQPRR